MSAEFRPKPLSIDRITKNVSVYNDPETGSLDILCSFNESLNAPIIENPKEWYLAITRFAIPGHAIPIFIMPIVADQNKLNLTPFIVTLSMGGVNYKSPVLYTPSNDLASTDPEYYYMYDVQGFLDMINLAMSTAFNALKVANPIVMALTPYINYDVGSELLSLIIDSSLVSTLSISINSLLHKYLDSFQYVYNSRTPGIDYTFVLNASPKNWYCLPSVTISNPPQLLKISQECSCMCNWIELQSIVVSTTMQVNPEYLPYPGQINVSNGSNYSMGILTDFQPSFSSLKDARTMMQYVPSGGYRLTNFTSSDPLREFNVKVYWQDSYNILHPLELAVGYTASFKFMMAKKDTFTS